MELSETYKKLVSAFQEVVAEHGLGSKKLAIRCRDLSAREAIGDPEDRDYPIIKGRERMMEAELEGACGQAFSDEYGCSEYRVADLLQMPLAGNRSRADFIAALNAVFRYLGLCDHTVHCRDHEPRECAAQALKTIGSGKKILLVGLQPRFLEFLSRDNAVRVVDLDEDNIGATRFGVVIEPAANTPEAIAWCDLIFATGSTVVNDTISTLTDRGKPVLLYGVSAAAPAKVLGLETFCYCGH